MYKENMEKLSGLTAKSRRHLNTWKAELTSIKIKSFESQIRSVGGNLGNHETFTVQIEILCDYIKIRCLVWIWEIFKIY